MMVKILQLFLLLSALLLCANHASSAPSESNDDHSGEEKSMYCQRNKEDANECSIYLPPANNPTLTLRNGVQLPLFSLGLAHFTFGAPHVGSNKTFVGFYPSKSFRQIELALQKGIRSFDTALMYGTQPHLGQVLGQWWASGRLKSREDVFLTTKVFHKPAPKFGLKRNHQWNLDDMTPEQVAIQTEDHIEQCLQELQVGYIDLLLMHWPSGEGQEEGISRQRRLAAWKVFEDFYQRGWVRAIGVSNFCERHMDQLMQDGATIRPMVNQIESSPYLQYESIVSYCRDHEIQAHAYSPMGSGLMNVQNDAVLQQLGKAHQKDVGQVVFRYLIQKGYAIAFQTNSPERMVSNLDVLDFELDEEEMKAIYGLIRVNGSFGLPSPHDLP
ncbi:Deoxymugineic acid synthase 1 [Seminavis robusta]|uniref:Deoxymugineic acid synthase 1 n=1 Tax=Seminavis robusta TaxID=568900 RepID=A0A9N8DS53_9STRA|nr:Deoxymugineic acid synthase 1 [Seminavis robusta]|eukprot:Sro313_g114930.1 Deoxymugineic acid synthase 1 (385) ;mRNA; r:61932-63086